MFGAIKEAEKRLVATQDSKAYLGPEGDMGFVEALMPYVFGAANPTMDGRIEGMQTPGGTGSLRLALAMVKKAQSAPPSGWARPAGPTTRRSAPILAWR